MKHYLKLFLGLLLFIITSCNKDEEIKSLLNSKNVYEIIEGASEAGHSGDKKYIPLLLLNAGDQRATTKLKFKGYSIYQEKMYALKTILHVKPPDTITSIVDSINIKFFENYWQKLSR